MELKFVGAGKHRYNIKPGMEMGAKYLVHECLIYHLVPKDPDHVFIKMTIIDDCEIQMQLTGKYPIMVGHTYTGTYTIPGKEKPVPYICTCEKFYNNNMIFSGPYEQDRDNGDWVFDINLHEVK